MYAFIRTWLRLALYFYCKKVRIHSGFTKISKPAILASNHPNSFFDAIIVAAYYPREIYFLARGDAFKKKWAAWILKRLNLIPIYRLEEGKQHLGNNEQSFAACMEVFRKGGTILIFPEGLSRHELELRPLRKGAARLAFQAWKEGNITDLVVQPISLVYNSFEVVPKVVDINYPDLINSTDVNEVQEAIFYNKFNTLLKERLANTKPLIAQPTTHLIASMRIRSKKLILALPAFIGYASQKWFYLLWKNIVDRKTKDSVFYDSVLFASMMLTYPIMVILVTIILVSITNMPIFWLLLFLLPFTALAYKEYKSL